MIDAGPVDSGDGLTNGAPSADPVRDGPKQGRDGAVRRVTLLGAAVNVALTVLKGVAGVLAGSSVMVADAVHSLSDLVSDGVALWALRAGAAPPDEDHPYGHGRFETIATVGLAGLLISAGLGIAWDAWGRFGQAAQPGALALWAAAVSIAAKEALYHVTARVGRAYDSPLVVANAWHHRTDAMSSIAALLGILGARAGFPILDPVAAMAVGALVLHVGFKLLRGAAREMTDASLGHDLLVAMQDEITRLPGVVSLHALRARRMGSRVLVDVHIEVAGATTVSDGHQVAERVRSRIHDLHADVSEVLVHVDPEDDETLEPGEALATPREDIEAVIRARAAKVAGVRAVSHIAVHYLRQRVVAQVAITVDERLRVGEAALIARRLRRALEFPDGVVDTADIHLELNDQAHDSLDPEIAEA